MARLLDLFCGAGGASKGYHRAGFEVVGVDIAPQKRYPFEFHQADALAFLSEHGKEYDAIHASPPCQAYTSLRVLWNRSHPDLIDPTRQLLRTTGLPYVIENVPGAPMRGRGITLCGSMFRLYTVDGSGMLRRHRHFESNIPLVVRATCNHCKPAVPCFGGGGQKTRNGRKHFREHHRREVMGIAWMNRHELSQAIPPVYTEWIGRQLILYLENRSSWEKVTRALIFPLDNPA